LSRQPDWVREIFGETNGRPHLLDLIRRDNPDLKREGEPVVLWLDEQELPPAQIDVRVGNRPLQDPDEIERLAQAIEESRSQRDTLVDVPALKRADLGADNKARLEELQQQLQETDIDVADLEAQFQRERRRFQDNERTLNEQMQAMADRMTKERAELARERDELTRQRDDLLRQQGEIRRELERLVRLLVPGAGRPPPPQQPPAS
jgi:hypothetical protein